MLVLTLAKDVSEMKHHVLVIDIRPNASFTEGHLSGALHVDKLNSISFGLKIILGRCPFTVVMGPTVEQIEDVPNP